MPASVVGKLGSRWFAPLAVAAGLIAALIPTDPCAAQTGRGAGAGDSGGLFPATPGSPATPSVGKSSSKPSPEPPINAGTYEQLEVDSSLSNNQTRTLVRRMLPNGFGPGDEATFNAFYTKYWFPRWTQPANITSLPDFRTELSNDTRSSGESGAAARAQLVQLALTFLTKFANGKYHPAVRYNAMLAIGDLYAQGPSAGRTAELLPAALPIMLEAVKSANQVDAVKMAALIGIRRHAALGIADQQYRDQELVPSMLTVATTKVSPGRKSEGHAWIRAVAIDVLGEIGSVGQKNAVINALAEIAANSETPFVTRCAAARALGKLRYDPNAELDPQQLAAQVARLAADALAHESDQKTPDFESMLLSRRSGSTPVGIPRVAIGGLFFGRGKPGAESPIARAAASAAPAANPALVELKEEYSLMLRRRLLNRVSAVREGFIGLRDAEHTGIDGLAKTPRQKSYRDALTERLDSIVDLCENERLPYEGLVAKIKQEASLLRETIDKRPADKANGAEPTSDKADANTEPEAKTNADVPPPAAP